MSSINEFRDPDQDWRNRAACKEVDPEIFFPVGESNTLENKAVGILAQQICRRCTEVNVCLGYALSTDQKFGVWGGLTTYDRRRLIGSRKRKPS